MPYIEKSSELVELYKRNEGLFWIRLWDPYDYISKFMDTLIIDGAHRRHVSLQKKLSHMRTLWLRPTTSVNELVIIVLVVLWSTHCVSSLVFLV